jgi:hypothetical protein
VHVPPRGDAKGVARPEAGRDRHCPAVIRRLAPAGPDQGYPVPFIAAAREGHQFWIVFRRPVCRQGHRGGCPSVSAVAGVEPATVPTVNAGACSLRFFFAVTLKRRDLADAVVSVREPLPPPHCSQPARGRSPAPIDDEHQARAALSLTYATGLRSSEVISLKLTDIDSERMVIRVEQGKKDRYVILSPNLLELLRE